MRAEKFNHMPHLCPSLLGCFILGVVFLFTIKPVFAAEQLNTQEVAWCNIHAADYVVINASPLDLSGGAIRVGETQLPVLDLEVSLPFKRYCATGAVVSVLYECIYRRREGAQSIAVIEFDVEELYWGADADFVVFETFVSRVDCSVVYEMPKYDKFDVGDKFLILGSSGHPINFVREFGLLKVEANEVHAINGQVWTLYDVQAMLRAQVADRLARQVTGKERFKLQR